jgi:hypothetical protein
VGSLSAKNASEKFSRSGTFKEIPQKIKFEKKFSSLPSRLVSKLPNKKKGGALSLRMGGWAKTFENLHASPFGKVLSNETSLRQIHLAGQHL